MVSPWLVPLVSLLLSVISVVLRGELNRMVSTTRHLDRFVRAVHRRWVGVRVAESVGVGVLGGCAVALLMLPILLWRGEPALPVVLMTATMAALAGLIAGLLRRPSLMSAASEADRQLHLADLLSTALLTRSRAPADAWAMMIVAHADARCRTLSPNAVVLNRLGGRAWGGIGLMTALVLTLGLMSAGPQPWAAVARGGVAVETGRRDPSAPDAPRASLTASTRAPGETPQSRRDPHDRREAGIDRETEGSTSAAGPSNDDDSRPGSASEGGGAGEGLGLATSPRESDGSASPTGASPTASPTHSDGVGAGGGASSVPVDQSDDSAPGFTAAARSGAAATPAWRGASVPVDGQQPLSGVDDRRVPDGYRDLVRAYFDETIEPPMNADQPR